MSSTEQPEGQIPAPQTVAASDEVTIRRAPRFGVFIVGGALLGVIVAVIVVAATMNIDRGGTTEDVSFMGLAGYFALWGGAIGLTVGAIVAVILDRILARRPARLTAERVAVDLPPETVEGELEGGDAEREDGVAR